MAGGRGAFLDDVNIDSVVVELLDDGGVIGILGAEPSEIGDDEPGHVLPLGSIEHLMQAVAAESDVNEDLGDSSRLLADPSRSASFPRCTGR